MGATRAAKPFADKTDIISKKIADLVHIGRGKFGNPTKKLDAQQAIDRTIKETEKNLFVGNHNPNRLPANSHYKAGPARYDYYTDESSRIIRGHADELKRKPMDRPRIRHVGSSHDKIKGIDNAGHLFVDRFDGSHKLDNIVSQAEVLNQRPGRWYDMEEHWDTVMKPRSEGGFGGQIKNVEIALVYEGPSKRPSGFAVAYDQIIDGESERVVEEFFENVKTAPLRKNG